MNILRKKVLISLMVFALVVMLGSFSSVAADTSKEIKVGIIGPMTGWASVYGQYVVDGVKLFF